MHDRTLDEIESLEDLSTLISSAAWSSYLQELAEGEDTDARIEALRRAISRARTRLSPEHASPELQALKAAIYADATAPEETLRPLLTRIAALRAALPTQEHARLFGRLEAEISRTFAWMNGGTGYSNRARRAQHLFTDFAGQTHIAGAETDKHGNALGSGYDLGRDGAFEGYTVHVLQLYTGEGFDFSQPTRAFTRKGFTVDRRTQPGTAAELDAWLADAQQLWLISHMRPILTDAHVDVIRAFWQRGGALYVWGDNDPYYVDANRVIRALLDETAGMKGNLPGGRIVNEYADNQGFLPNLVTTGLAHLFEGITIASLPADVMAAHGFAPLLYGSAGNLVTVIREASEQTGAFMIDTAFTRLYCQWDEAGSARYVCNAACFLAASGALNVAPEVEEEPAPPTPQLSAEGAFTGTCDLSGRGPEPWMVISVSTLGDALQNTSDRVLNDPLSAGATSQIFSDAVYTEAMGQWLLNLEPAHRRDPITGAPVVATLPLLDLSDPTNLKAFTEILCVCLMDGKLLRTAAQLIFFAAVDEMLAQPTVKHRAAFEYLRRQCLDHFRTTRDFSSMGEKVPLKEAMASLVSPATEPRVRLRRSFESVGVIGRTVLQEGSASAETVRRIGRRALINVTVRSALAAEKQAPGSVPHAINRMLYDNVHGIPTLNGGRLVSERPDFVRDVSTAAARLAGALGMPALMTDDEHTIILHALLSYDLRQFSAEAAVQRMLTDNDGFRAIYDDEGVPDAVAILNARFRAYAADLDLTDPHLAHPAPFATTYGPSVFQCVCGTWFGDPHAPLTEARLEALRAARTAHFREVYNVRSSDPSRWYPEAGTLHYNLHRAIQVVLKEQFTDATAFCEEMMPAVAAYLLADGKGFIYDPLLASSMREALESYLTLRRAGEPHPEGLLTLEVKARREQQARQRRHPTRQAG